MKKLFLPLFILSLFMFSLACAVDRYVDLNNLTPSAPYTDWTTAVTEIQSAVDAASAGDTIWVTNGVYNTGGRSLPGDDLINRVCVINAIEIRSVNGPEVTVIEGRGPLGTNAVRCVVLVTNATLSGFTVTNGHCSLDADDHVLVTDWLVSANISNGIGGGIESSNGGVFERCIISNNWASGSGGGICGGTVVNCIIQNNWAQGSGGGVYDGVAVDCTIDGNWSEGSGAECAKDRPPAVSFAGTLRFLVTGGGGRQCDKLHYLR